MRVLLICNEQGVSEFYRALTPYRLLADAGEIELTVDDGRSPAIIDHLEEFEAVVFSRPDSAEYSLILTEAKARGLRTVVDVDDNLLLIPPSIGVYNAWHERGTGKLMPRAWYFKRNIRAADVLTVSTAALGRQLCDGEPHKLRPAGDYMVLENCVLAEEWSGVRGQGSSEGLIKPAGEIWVGWWGIYHHWDDWRDVAPYIEPVIASRPQVKLVLLGMPELAHLFPVLRQSGQLVVGPFVQNAQELGPYREIIKQFDVALAPTADCPFNEAKSDLKVLQYGAAGVPVIASAVTYGAWRGYGAVYLSDKPSEWGEVLSYLLDDRQGIEYPVKLLQEAVLATRTYECQYRRWLAPLGLASSTAESGDAGQQRYFWRETPAAALAKSGDTPAQKAA